MGRATSGVTGMKFRSGDHLLAMDVVEAGAEPDVFVVFENGLAKRTPVGQYRLQGRGGLGIKVAKISEKGGDLVGALIVTDGDEVLVVMEKGKIVRSRVDEVRTTGRDTSGVKFAAPDAGDAIIAVAKNPERGLGDDEDDAELEPGEAAADAVGEDLGDGPGDAPGDAPGETGPDGEGAVQAASSTGSADAEGGPDGVASPESQSDESETPEVERE
jgi:DNA gyrase subunit A